MWKRNRKKERKTTGKLKSDRWDAKETTEEIDENAHLGSRPHFNNCWWFNNKIRNLLIGKHILQYKFATSLMTKKREKKKRINQSPQSSKRNQNKAQINRIPSTASNCLKQFTCRLRGFHRIHLIYTYELYHTGTTSIVKM
jgi:hypothetical protein